MADNELFRAAMDAYDNQGRHSDGIYAVVELVRTETRKQIESDIERYPLMQRLNDQLELTRFAEADTDRMRSDRDRARSDLAMAEVLVGALRTRLDQLDAKRSDRPPLDAPKGLDPGWWFVAPAGTPTPVNSAERGVFVDTWSEQWSCIGASTAPVVYVLNRCGCGLRFAGPDAGLTARMLGMDVGYESHDHTVRAAPFRVAELDIDVAPDHTTAKLVDSGFRLYTTDRS